MKNPRVLFLLKFVAIIVILYVVIAIHPVNDHVIVPFTALVTRTSALMLKLIGEKVTVTGTAIRSSTFAVNVENGCNGIEAIILLVAAIGAFPARWMARVWGIIAGFFIVQFFNVFRVAMLFWLGENHPSVFQTFHVAVWGKMAIRLDQRRSVPGVELAICNTSTGRQSLRPSSGSFSASRSGAG